MISFGDKVYSFILTETGYIASVYGPEFFILGYIADIIWASLFIALIILILKTKLTYVEGFRNNFLIGIILLLLESLVWILNLRIFFVSFAENQGPASLIMASLYISAGYFLIRGLLKLNNYLDTIIGTKEQRNNLNALIFAIIITATYQVSDTLVHGVNPLGIPSIILTSTIFISQLYISIYSFYLHRDMKDLKINMMLYFGIGFLFLVLIIAFGSIFEFDTSLYLTSIGYTYLGFQVFLILGYLDFKNRISKIKTEI